MGDTSSIITKYCQYVDYYNSLTVKKFSIISWYYKKKMYKLLKGIKSKITNMELDRELMNDFFRNYLATNQIIRLDDCNCIENKDQYIFTIRGDVGVITISTRKALTNDIISVNMRKDTETYMRTFTYIYSFRSNKKESSKVGRLCESLLYKYIEMYLDARLEFKKVG
jgi:hypothetical protein